MMTSPYAWIIDHDHLADGPDWNEKSTVGPRTADISDDACSHSQKCAELARNYEHKARFKMFDGDGVLYYSGTLYWNGDTEPLEDYTYAPLGDFGTPNAGAILITYPGHPEWDCG